MKTLAIIVLILVVAVGAVLAYAATRPDTFSIQRAMSMKAPPDKVFALINDFRQWRGWSPWEKMDPDLKRDYSGAPNGKGAIYAWQGNSKVGQGRMEIVESSPPSKVAIQLDFIKPFEARNIVEFTLTANGGMTDVSWVMRGRNLFIGKVMSLFVNMDKMVGKDFEAGLAGMKALAEK
jgi:uncharacterized protein YndB with AHSA1/START domain